MPSADEMVAYANDLPPIYRDILAAFPTIEPHRQAGYGLAFPTLAMYFANRQRGHSLGDVQVACRRLADNGFLEIKNEVFAHPTDLGEQLIAIVADRPRASNADVPQLPARTW